MKSYIYIVIILLVLIAIEQALKKKPKEKTSLPIAGAYQKRWLLSLNALAAQVDEERGLVRTGDQAGPDVGYVVAQRLDRRRIERNNADLLAVRALDEAA